MGGQSGADNDGQLGGWLQPSESDGRRNMGGPSGGRDGLSGLKGDWTEGRVDEFKDL